MRYCAHVDMRFNNKREERDAVMFGHRLDKENTCSSMPKNTHQ